VCESFAARLDPLSWVSQQSILVAANIPKPKENKNEETVQCPRFSVCSSPFRAIAVPALETGSAEVSFSVSAKVRTLHNRIAAQSVPAPNKFWVAGFPGI
jgi:hypothetical protein